MFTQEVVQSDFPHFISPWGKPRVLKKDKKKLGKTMGTTMRLQVSISAKLFYRIIENNSSRFKLINKKRKIKYMLKSYWKRRKYHYNGDIFFNLLKYYDISPFFFFSSENNKCFVIIITSYLKRITNLHKL